MGTVTALRIPESPETWLHSIARECLEASEGNKDKAARRIRRKIEENKSMQKALIDPMIMMAIDTIVRQAAQEMRQRVKRKALAPPRPDDTTGLLAVAEETREQIYLTYRIAGGEAMLGDATKEMLLTERDAHIKRAEGSQKMANLMHFLARKLEKRTVGAQFSEIELAEIFRKFLKD